MMNMHAMLSNDANLIGNLSYILFLYVQDVNNG